jgi:NADPH:quinone reductase-like Zn-dependent oxidoreductase
MTNTMQAVRYTQYGTGDVLHLETLPVPTPGPDEVLIRVHASTVTAGDVNVRGFTFVPEGMKWMPRLMFGLTGPKPQYQILGVEIAGDVVAVGANVTRFKVGDAVFGIDSSTLGGYGEYAVRKADGALAHKPENVSYAEAAALAFGAGTALYFLQDKANVQAGEHVLVNGASGGVGSAAVQIAKALGAEVTGVCSGRNVEMVRELGADHVIDYTQTDITQNGITYDVIVNTVSGTLPFAAAQAILKPGGRYAAVAGGLGDMVQSAWNKQLIAGTPPESRENMEKIQQMAEAGQITPFIDRTYPLAETAEAHRYVDTQRKRGNVVIAVTGEGGASAKVG